jgi:hypothetical protein
MPLAAQEGAPEMTAEQKAEMEAWAKAGALTAPHQAMAKQVGSYSAQIKSWQAPGTDPVIELGTTKRSLILDGRVLIEDFDSTMMGQSFQGHGMRGYDNVTGKHWSTWNDSMSTGIMTSEGDCDGQMTCTFVGSWVEPVNKKTITSRMVSRWTGPDTEIFEMYVPGADGKEFRMMEITYTRQP